MNPELLAAAQTALDAQFQAGKAIGKFEFLMQQAATKNLEASLEARAANLEARIEDPAAHLPK